MNGETPLITSKDFRVRMSKAIVRNDHLSVGKDGECFHNLNRL
jgi:hypothetical protein